ncbi:DUF2628 domain-containing protein [Flavobacterium sp.]|uniref:DUF2628 domain-containing protein n=1 Tax=Flavobacterium sp. TaxID=239 RepID=UPI003750B6D7
MTQNNQFNGKNYDEVWADRFQFFNIHGVPSSSEFKNAYKQLPFMKKMRMNMNFYAFFFSFIYFLIKGMWKGAITLILIWGVLSFIAYKFPTVGTGLSLAYAMIAGMTANYTFYRKEVLGEDDFNIFKGMKF